MKVRLAVDGWADSLGAVGIQRLHPGIEYVVLEVFCRGAGTNEFRIEYSPNELPALFDGRLFEVSSAILPDNWSIATTWAGAIKVGPAGWRREEFWEAFVDREDWAVDLYRKERDRTTGRS